MRGPASEAGHAAAIHTNHILTCKLTYICSVLFARAPVLGLCFFVSVDNYEKIYR